MRDYPSIRLLVGGYLNLDWMEDCSSVWECVTRFAEHEELAFALPKEVDAALEEFSSESSMKQFIVDQCGSGYVAEADGWTYRAWLAEVRTRVRDSLS